MSYIDKYTEEELEKLERKIAREYRKAYKELDGTSKAYFQNFQARYANEFRMYEDGGYTDAEFQAWLNSQIARGEHWDALKSEMAARYRDANQLSVDYINNTTPKIYAQNANYAAYQIENTTMAANFNLVNESTIRNLMLEGSNNVSFRVNSLNPIRDYDWNAKQIQSALTQGILQGDSIDKISNRFMQVMKRNEVAARRNARTSVTSAQNAGRQDTFEKAAEMGIELEKEWICAHDDRTRDSHAELDGVRVPYDEPFPNGLMYPGDSAGEPEEIYNCRCTMRVIINGINSDARTPNDVDSYNAWKREKDGI